MQRGAVAAGLAAAGVALAAMAIVAGFAFAVSGAPLLAVAPLLGLPIALAVHGALRRTCHTGSRAAQWGAAGGVVALVMLAVGGLSFGGIPLLLPALCLVAALAVTPRPMSG
jgi:hypothetical protein